MDLRDERALLGDSYVEPIVGMRRRLTIARRLTSK